MKSIILFGHGARDIRWREPFDRLCAMWRAQHPDNLVEVAFLESMQPTLYEAISTLTQLGTVEIVVVPVFFGQGGHLRNDFPELLENCRKQYPELRLSLTHPAGEDSAVLQAIVDLGARYI